MKPPHLEHSLLARVMSRSVYALETGALEPIPTELHRVPQDGLLFDIRMRVGKRTKPKRKEVAVTGRNPFLPWENDLFVGDLGPRHGGVLNKYPVVEDHLLIVTRVFEDQEIALTPSDFQAAHHALVDYDGLLFYNSGAIAGASQPHRHLQYIPLPEGQGPKLPISPLLSDIRFRGLLGIAPGLPYQHAVIRWPEASSRSARAWGEEIHLLYRMALGACGLINRGQDGTRPAPYNLLATREWLMIIPRQTERFSGVSVNAMGFAGALLVKNKRQMKGWLSDGPFHALCQVGFPARR